MDAVWKITHTLKAAGLHHPLKLLLRDGKESKKIKTSKGVRLKVVNPDAAGIEVVLANPLQVKNLMDDKTDAADAEWLMLLHSYGLVKPSFQPENVTRQIRNLTRHRQNLIRTAGTEVQRMQKSMELMNIKLSTVISDVLGKSGQAIIRAILGGNHDPKSLSELADGRCKASKETIAKSLEGTWDEDLLFMLRQSVDLYDYLQNRLRRVIGSWRNCLKRA